MENRKLPQIPRFENESDEAQWWFDHREELSQDFANAARNGTLGEGSLGRAERKRTESAARETAA